MTTLVDRKHLLTSVEMAHFVSHGSVVLSAVVPDSLNERAIEVLDAGLPGHPYGTPLDTAFPVGTFVRELLRAARGRRRDPEPGRSRADRRPPRRPHPPAARRRGAEPARRRDHRHPGRRVRRPAHVLPARGDARAGRHADRARQPPAPHQRDRHRPLPEPAGQTRLTCPAGTVVLLHHGIWHGGRRNDSDQPPLHVQDPLQPDRPPGPAVEHRRHRRPGRRARAATSRSAGRNANEGRLEMVNRVKLWRLLTGDELFDIDYYLTRETDPAEPPRPRRHRRATRVQPVRRRLGSVTASSSVRPPRRLLQHQEGSA